MTDDKRKPTSLFRETSANRNQQGSKGNIAAKESNVMTVLRMFDDDADDLHWPAYPWVAVGRPTMLFGAKGVGKTFVAQDLFLAVDLGRKWLGSLDVEHGRAVFLDYEPKVPLLHRIRQLADKSESITSMDSVGYPRPMQLSERGAEAWLIEVCRGTTLLVIDSLAAATSGQDENTSREALDLLTRVSVATGAACLVIHHEGHKGRRPRGYTGIADACGMVARISMTENNVVTMTCMYPGPAGIRPDPLSVELVVSDDINPKTRLPSRVRLCPTKTKTKRVGNVLAPDVPAWSKTGQAEKAQKKDLAQPTRTDDQLVTEAREKLGDKAATIGIRKLATDVLGVGYDRAKRIHDQLQGGSP